MNQPTSEIIVYWRPGCGYCSSLLRKLDSRHVAHRRVNIWDEPEAAAIVRAAANGNETVPTVQIGPVALVNPDVNHILAAAVEHAPDSVPEGWEPPQPNRFTKWVADKLG